MIALDSANIEKMRKLVKNDEVLAIYPDTSCFYAAVVAQAPRRSSILTGSTEPTIMVQFHGDEGDSGIMYERRFRLSCRRSTSNYSAVEVCDKAWCSVVYDQCIFV